MIPKIIHYCWFGGGQKSEIVLKCLASWKQHLTDYRLIEWNEENIDFTASYALVAYADQKWALVSDYVRFKVLWDYGGIYLDTDMLILKSLDPFLVHKLFFGCERPAIVSMGILGCEKGNSFIRQCKEKYEAMSYDPKRPLVITRFVTEMLRPKEFQRCNTITQLKDNITLYPPVYFYPFPFPPHGDYKKYIQPESVAVHLWEGSWLSEWELFKIGAVKSAFDRILQHIRYKPLSKGYLFKALIYSLISPFWLIKSWLRRLLKPEFKL